MIIYKAVGTVDFAFDTKVSYNKQPRLSGGLLTDAGLKMTDRIE